MALLCLAIAGTSVGVTVSVCLCFGRMAGLQEYEEQTTHVPDSRTRSGLWVAEGDEPERRTHPLYKKLSEVNRTVNAMSRGQLKRRLGELNMDLRGEDSILSKRLKNHLRRETILQEPHPPWELHDSIQTNPYGLDYLLILDFEATCQQVNPPDFIHEIIEFPVLMLSLKTLTVEAKFHTYCRPFLNPNLSDFCKNLTGIRQEQVDSSPYFPEVFRRFTEWLKDKELGSTHKFSIVTDCPWDIKECLFPQCILSRVQFPHYAIKWIDVRKLFSSFYNIKSGNLASMLDKLALKFEGREHCGLHDSENIARVLVRLIKDGCILKYNRFMPDDVVASFSNTQP